MAKRQGHKGHRGIPLRTPLKNPQPALIHVPVLLQTVIDLLNIRPGGRYIDCTMGTAGHAAAILEKSLPGGSLLGIDADPRAIEVAKKRLEHYGGAAILVNGNFRYLRDICREHNFYPVEGILFDLGLSSLQLEDEERGFSFRFDAPLDMRFNPGQPITAANIINNFPEGDLAALLRKYGEEPQSRLIARRIVSHRPINTTLQLANVVGQSSEGSRGKINPSTRTFQALRIAVNQELTNIEEALEQTIDLLHPRGRLVVISYHSMEDRLVKQFMQRESKGCLCPPEVPICNCGHNPTLKLINRKVITPSMAERKDNPRSRSAKLRAAERL